jgi:biopolymer transport protein ExbB/TolQ
MDEIDLERTEITGNQELPKVLYIVPWQKSDPGDLTGKPVNTLLDEVLAPIDRSEFRVFMYPILIVFALGLAIAVERWTYLTMSGASNRSLWKKIVPYLKAGNFQEAAAVTGKSKAAIGSILTYGLYRVKSARRRDDVEKAMEESLMEVLPRLEKRTHYLATLANIATLLGLLGTIIGLIRSA